MNTSTIAKTSLLVETGVGTIIAAPQQASVSQNYAATHPFVSIEGARLFAGPDADAAVKLYRNAEDFDHLDVVVYEIQSTVAGAFNIRKLAHQ